VGTISLAEGSYQKKNLKIKSLKVAALKNLTNLQPHLSAIQIA